MSDTLREHLHKHFRPATAAGLDATFCLMIGDDSALTLRVKHGELDFIEETHPDATFYFSDRETAEALLSGRADPFDAFMKGLFRADGYLVWAFALMAMFRADGLSEPTRE